MGLLPKESNPEVSEAIPAAVLSECRWINIPRVYLEQPSLVKSMLPILLVTGVVVSMDYVTALNLLESLPSDAATVPIPTLPAVLPDGFADTLDSYLSVFINTIEYSILVRLATLIGTNRDVILAANIQETAKEFKVHKYAQMHCISDACMRSLTQSMVFAHHVMTVYSSQGGKVVVVNGMLHSNGIARWILSGLKPSL